MRSILTLCLIHDTHRVLLGMKKRGFGAGRWNGFGGKVHAGESILDGARRELREEAGIEARDLIPAGVLEFEFRGKPDILEVYLFSATAFEGEPTESEEMRPQWFTHAEIPFEEMWPDDRHWVPLFLAGKNINAYFLFEGMDRILDARIAVVGDRT